MHHRQQSPGKSLYQIRVRGILDGRWADWFDGFEMTWVDLKDTFLTGWVTDQAELHGILGVIRNLGLDLLLVKKVDCVYLGEGVAECDLCQDCKFYQQDEKDK